ASSARARSSAAAATARTSPTRRRPNPAWTTSAPARCGPRRRSRAARRPAWACHATSPVGTRADRGSPSAASAWTGWTTCWPPGPPGWSWSAPSPRRTIPPPRPGRSPAACANPGDPVPGPVTYQAQGGKYGEHNGPQDDGRDRRRLRGVPDRGTLQQLPAAQDGPGPRRQARHEAHARLPGRAPGKGPARLPDGAAHHRAVLAVLRPPRGVRERRRRPARGRVAQLLAPGRHQRQDRDLARDVPGPGGRVRGDLWEHAAVRPGQG